MVSDHEELLLEEDLSVVDGDDLLEVDPSVVEGLEEVGEDEFMVNLLVWTNYLKNNQLANKTRLKYSKPQTCHSIKLNPWLPKTMNPKKLEQKSLKN